MVRRLDPRREAHAPAVAVELDPSRERELGDGESVVRVETAELDALGKHEDVPREPVPALVRRDPEPVVLEARCERAVDGSPVVRAARITRAVPADEDELRIHRLSGSREIETSELVRCRQLDTAQFGAVLGSGRD